MKVLITGINGFLGQNLSRAFMAAGHEVVGLGRQDQCVIDVCEYFSGSVLDQAIVQRSCKGVQAIIHLAALTAHNELVDNRFNALELNFLGTKHVLDAFILSDTAEKFIFSSTGKVYGHILSVPIFEEHTCRPLNVLGKSKYLTEQLIDFYAHTNKQFVSLRIFNVFGPNQRSNFLIPTILSQLKSPQTFPKQRIVLGDIYVQRDYMYIDDLTHAFLLTLQYPLLHGLNTFNVASGIGVTPKKIVGKIASIMDIRIDIKVNKSLFRNDEKDVEYGSFEKINQTLGWEQQISLTDGLQRTIEATL